MIRRRTLAAWGGTDRIPLVRARLPQLAALPVTRASAELALFVAGVEVDRALLPVVDDELVEVAGGRARARVAVLPIGDALIVCDRADAPEDVELVCWPDDSSLHLMSAIPPGRRSRWIDLGCGSAVAPLARPALADQRVASDLNPRAIRYAQLGARLSHIALETMVGDLAVDGLAELITCNAPIPGSGAHRQDDPIRPFASGRLGGGRPRTTPGVAPKGTTRAAAPIWRATDTTFMARLFAAAESALSLNGLIVVHSALDAIPPLDGEAVTVAYTPASSPRQFAITWWQPDAAARQIRARRMLDPARPHLDHRDREAALAGNLPAL